MENENAEATEVKEDITSVDLGLPWMYSEGEIGDGDNYSTLYRHDTEDPNRIVKIGKIDEEFAPIIVEVVNKLTK